MIIGAARSNCSSIPYTDLLMWRAAYDNCRKYSKLCTWRQCAQMAWSDYTWASFVSVLSAVFKYCWGSRCAAVQHPAATYEV